MTEPALLDEVAALVRSSAKLPPTLAIGADSHLVDDLGIDSLDLVNVFVEVQDHYGLVIDDEDIPNLVRVSDLVAHVARHRATGSAAA